MVDVSQHGEAAPQHPGAGEAPNWRWIAHVLDWYAGNAPDSVHRASAARQAALVRGRAETPAEAQQVGTVAVSGIGHTVNWTYPPPPIGTPLYAHPPPSAPVGEVVDYQRALDLIGDAYNAGTHGIGYSQQAADLFDARAAPPSAPAAQGGGDADDGTADASVWTLIALMERVGGERDSGEEGSFITMTLDQVYALEALLTARGHDPGWVDAAPPSAPVCKACAGTGDMEVPMKINDMENDTTIIGCDACNGTGQQPPSAPGCGACADGCKDRGSCRVRDESPPSAPVGVEAMAIAYPVNEGRCDNQRQPQGTTSGGSPDYSRRPSTSAPDSGVEAIRHARAIIDHVIHGEPGHELSAAHDLLTAALAQQPAAVDEGRVAVRESTLQHCIRELSGASHGHNPQAAAGYVYRILSAALAAQQERPYLATREARG